MTFKFSTFVFGAFVLALPFSVNAQSCTPTDLADLGACAFAAAQECRDLYPGCTTQGQKLGQVITQQDILNSITSVCCVDSKTTNAQNSCIKQKSNVLLLRLNLLKAVANTAFKSSIAAAVRNVNELKRERCGSGTIVD